MSVNMCPSCLKPHIDAKVLILFSLSLQIFFFLFCGLNKIVLPRSTALATSQQNRNRGSWEVLWECYLLPVVFNEIWVYEY